MRKYIRHPMNVPIQVEPAEIPSAEAAQLQNFSLGGICIRTEQNLIQGQTIRITIPAVHPHYHIRGRVCWSFERSGHHEIGVEFMEQKDAFKVRMIEQLCYIKNYQKEQAREEGREISDQEAAQEWVAKYANQFIR